MMIEGVTITKGSAIIIKAKTPQKKIISKGIVKFILLILKVGTESL